MYITPLSGASLDAVAFPDGSHGWAAGAGVILATSDAGASWARYVWRSGGPGLGVSFAGPRYGWLLGGEGAVFATTAGGAVWTQIGGQ